MRFALCFLGNFTRKLLPKPAESKNHYFCTRFGVSHPFGAQRPPAPKTVHPLFLEHQAEKMAEKLAAARTEPNLAAANFSHVLHARLYPTMLTTSKTGGHPIFS